MKRPEYLAFIRQLPCVVCHVESSGWVKIDAAHVRYHSLSHGKSITGVGRKPDDRWVVPLCSHHHTSGGREAQHSNGEKVWWEIHEIDPLVIAALLFSHYAEDDISAARAVCLFAHSISQGVSRG